MVYLLALDVLVLDDDFTVECDSAQVAVGIEKRPAGVRRQHAFGPLSVGTPPSFTRHSVRRCVASSAEVMIGAVISSSSSHVGVCGSADEGHVAVVGTSPNSQGTTSANAGEVGWLVGQPNAVRADYSAVADRVNPDRCCGFAVTGTPGDASCAMTFRTSSFGGP